ncbi:methylmalonyl Co-A mutase-associated GTPase MeaB [Carboxydochorda subterranea]|uniref:Methylmalonyl Co-A mutase-associated GTPase MeaB n=1 Tax=Carboxydichorda subterranea TaxID=3109565 RepID=A0ABZ1BVC6_9FIRM|nr:methylmalonyl Co-A mutase-associated GTPase MeaB [Limnochorda sp. L945t]WRP16750.1 methylmalonyl Co-A mutase-associated GTPase MeaB [Limnochorda sp. L945t]
MREPRGAAARTVSLADRVRAGDRGALARALSLAEASLHDGVAGTSREAARACDELAPLLTGVVRAHVVGVTGSPGAGKSTLIGQLALELRRRGRKVGILAVDPTSPFTGGAVLGDRLRMSLPVDDPGIFMRSVASRGQQGGLALSVFAMVRVLDTAGMDVVLVETVGAGQNDVGVLGVAHTVVLVFNPGSGDEVQALKAGIVEIGDVMVVNKADLPGAHEAYRAIAGILHLSPPDTGAWQIPVVLVSSTRREGLGQLVEALESHRRYLESAPSAQQRRRLRAEWELRAALAAAVERHVVAPARQRGLWADLARRLADGELSARDAAGLLLRQALSGQDLSP